MIRKPSDLPGTGTIPTIPTSIGSNDIKAFAKTGTANCGLETDTRA